MATRKVEVAIVGDSASMVRAFRTADKAADSFDGTSSKLSRTMGVLDKAVMIGAAAIGGAMVIALKTGIQSLQEHEKADAQTAAAIKSTGGAAKVSATQIASMADALEKKTGIDDIAIKQGSNLLLTFTRIRNEAGKGNDIFNQTTKIMADMATAMGTDPKTAAMQLGKALNDPVKGVTALGRAGVQFTAEQKETIKTLVESGRVMDAQKLILKELETQFGGSAEAAGKTFAGRLAILRARLEEVAEKMAASLMPVLMALMDWVERNWPSIESAFMALWGALSRVGQVVASVVVPPLKAMFQFFSENQAIAATLIGALAGLYVGLKALMFINTVTAAVQALNLAMLTNPFVLVAAAIVAVGIALVALWKNSETFRTIVTGAWNGVKTVVGVFVDFFKGPVVAAFDIVSGVVKTIASLLRGDFSGAWEGIKQVVGGVVSAIRTTLLAIPGKLLEAAVAVAQAAYDLGKKIFDKIIEGLGDLGGAVKRKVSEAFGIAGEEGAINPYLPAIQGQGKKIASGVASGVSSNSGTVSNALSGVINNAKSDNDGKASAAGKDIGEALNSGLAQGLRNTINLVTGAWADIIEAAKAAAKRAAGIRSPSRVFANEIGKPMAMGVAMGIADNADMVSGAMTGLMDAEATVSASGSAMKAGMAAASGVTGTGAAVINLTFNGVLNAKDAARMLRPELDRLVRLAV